MERWSTTYETKDQHVEVEGPSLRKCLLKCRLFLGKPLDNLRRLVNIEPKHASLHCFRPSPFHGLYHRCLVSAHCEKLVLCFPKEMITPLLRRECQFC